MAEKIQVTNLLSNPEKALELNSKQVKEVLYTASNVLKHQRKLIDLPFERTLVVGDVHGDLTSVKKAFHLLESQQIDRIIFNGDVVDRGHEMIECVVAILANLALYPEKIFYLRGNHEIRSINSFYGFRGFVSNYWIDTYEDFQMVFGRLPIAAKLGNQAFVTHGGIPTETVYFHMMRLDLKKVDPPQGSTDWQFIWNDPDGRLNRFAPSIRGNGCYRFGRDVFNEFMELHNLEYFIRSHSVFKPGYKWHFANRLLTVFSSKAGPYRNVTPHFAHLTEDSEIELIKVSDIKL